MSDTPRDPWAPDGSGAELPPPPTAPPLAIDEPATVDATPIHRGGIGARVGAIGMGIALLVGGGAFAATQVGGSGGSEDPEAAVAAMFDAMGDEDVLGMLAALDAGERDTLRGPVEDLFEELERLEVVDDDFALTGIAGVDLEFDDLTYRTEPILDGLARVHLTGGTASYAVDGAELPVGDFLADALERFDVDLGALDEQDRDDVAGSDTFLVARETDDGWRVSLGYTAAEAARLSMSKPVPATGMAPIGAESPEAAVEGFLRAATQVDLRGLVARLSPAELRALHHYWPVLVDESDLPTADDLDATIELTDLELEADVDGDRARVSIRSIGADWTTDDFDGGATYADGCVTLRGDARDEIEEELDVTLDGDRICLDDLQDLVEEAQGGDQLGVRGLDDALPDLGELPELAITTTEVDGRWYVAPIGTLADAGLDGLRALDREDLESALDAFEDIFGGPWLFGTGMVGGGYTGPEDLGELDFELGTEDGWAPFPEDAEDQGAIGTPITPTGAVDPDTAAQVEQLAVLFVKDLDDVGCVLAELEASATTQQWYELADAQATGEAPSDAALDLLLGAVERCGT